MTRRLPVSLLVLLGSAVLWVGSGPYDFEQYPLPSVQLPGLHLGADTPAHTLHVTVTGTYLQECDGGLDHLIIYLQPNQLTGPEHMSLSFGAGGFLRYSAPLTDESSDLDFEKSWDACVDGTCEANLDIVFRTEGDADILLEPTLELDLTCHDSYRDIDDFITFETAWSHDTDWPFEEEAE